MATSSSDTEVLLKLLWNGTRRREALEASPAKLLERIARAVRSEQSRRRPPKSRSFDPSRNA